MKQFVIVTFVIENKEAMPKDPEVLREAFGKIELFSALSGSDNRVFELGDDTFAGTFNADNVTGLADELLEKAGKIFDDLGLKGRILVSAGEHWVWRAQVISEG